MSQCRVEAKAGLGLSQEPGREWGCGKGQDPGYSEGNRETEIPGKFLPNELLREIAEEPFPPRTLQLSGTSPGK